MFFLYMDIIDSDQDKDKLEKLYLKYRKQMKYIAFKILNDDKLAEDAAQYNHYHWEELNLMASTIENIGFTKDGIKEIYPFINAKVFSCSAGLYPAFNGDAAYTSVLNTYYVSLAQDICSSQDLTGEKSQEAIDIFKDATLALKELTMDILKMSEQEKDKVALRKVGSPIYNDAENMIKEYCNKYGKMISEFNHSYERTTRNIMIDKIFSENGITVNLNHLKLSSEKTVVCMYNKN